MSSILIADMVFWNFCCWFLGYLDRAWIVSVLGNVTIGASFFFFSRSFAHCGLGSVF
ncbi:hypothetical protein F4859DRAFT_487615 [Xylaria cf. heliscus]|nr:hypothetical protein F4859DRAFT_487615 [Xylaria cf. heliscus]